MELRQKYKLIRCESGITHYQSKECLPLSSASESLVRNGMIEFFSAEDAKKIVDSSGLQDGALMTRMSGSSLWVPHTRMSILPFFVLVFGMALAFSVPIAPKHIYVGSFIEQGGAFIFPLSFIFTDLVNELYGYQMARWMIRFAAFMFLIFGVIIDFSFIFPSAPYLSKDIVDSYNTVFFNIPKLLYIGAVGLIVADTLNAYLFSIMKLWLNGSALWLRSVLSTMFGQFVFTTTCISILYFNKLFLIKTWQFVLTNVAFKVIFAICALPIMYSIVWLVKFNEEREYNFVTA